LGLGLAFLTPNILGFLTFTFLPLMFSLMLAFTNWDLRLHNMFKDEPLLFTGIENFLRLIVERDFWQYLGNTLFLMMAIPFGIAGSLGAALLLSSNMGREDRQVWIRLLLLATLVGSSLALVALGAGGSAMTILLCGLTGGILLVGTAGGSIVYRTLFYMPHFTAGVATFILWKELYNPRTGPINAALRPVLVQLGQWVKTIPPELIQSGTWVGALVMVGLVFFGGRQLARAWQDGELGSWAAVSSIVVLLLPAFLGLYWSANPTTAWFVAIAALIVVAVGLVRCLRAGCGYPCSATEAFATWMTFSCVLMVGQFVLLGLGNVLYMLPDLAGDGLTPPEWLGRYLWAKPAIMIMALWAAVGSNNMILYLAGLSNVPLELYEAAEVDGASGFQRFWHVTWPQLAPVTFFIVVMSTIAGLQGGFEMARTMTQGGPAGSTTTLSYYVYTEGFTTGRLGYAAAISWTLFALVFTVTLFNWRFGSRRVEY
jgi:multiple sugar transport system permease protein